MDTPLNKQGPRRRLKKIMKKSRVNLHASTQNLYQRKLKSAINVSLNSTRNVRTLQANNRSLASSLEKMRQDFRQAHDHYTHLLEKNHDLRERILELERLVEASASVIEEEVNKRVEKRMQHVRKKLATLNTHTTGFLETLMELSEMCCSRTSSSSSSIERNSSNSQVSVQDQRLSSPGFTTLRALDVPRPESETLSTDSMATSQLLSSTTEDVLPTAQPGTVHEMTFILEQSVMCPPPEAGATVNEPLESVSENETVTTSSSEKQITVSKLPQRVLKSSREPKKYSAQQMSSAISKFNTKMNSEAARKLMRRETFTITSDQAMDSALITDIVMPQFLVPGQTDDGSGEPTSDTETLASNEEHVLSPTARLTQKLNDCLDLTTQLEENLVLKTSPARLTQELSDCIDLTAQLEENLLLKTTPRSKVMSKNKKSHSPGEKCGAFKTSHKGVTERNKAGFNNSCKKRSLHIANEFKLVNAHQQIMNRMGEPGEESNPEYSGGSRSDQAAGEHTIHPVDDMELTMVLGSEPVLSSPAQSHNTHISGNNFGDGKSTRRASTRSRARSRSKARQPAEEVDQTSEFSEENVPDAVTMRFAKPGRFVFVASRKDSDGTRKNVPNVVPKARSKSKKQIAEMIDNLPQTEPQSIFDFHDKTPTCLNSDKQKSESLGTVSPRGALPKDRSRSRTGRQKQESSPKNADNQISRAADRPAEQDMQKLSFLGEGITYEQALKGSPAEPKAKYRTRSQSRGRRQKKSGEHEAKERTRSPGAPRNGNADAGGSPPRQDSLEGKSRGRSRSRLSGHRQTRSKSVKASDRRDGSESEVGEDTEGHLRQKSVVGRDSSPKDDRGRRSRSRKSRGPAQAVPQTETCKSPASKKRNPRAIADVTNLPLRKSSNRAPPEEDKVDGGESVEVFQPLSPPVPALRKKLQEMAEKEGGNVKMAAKQGKGKNVEQHGNNSEAVSHPHTSLDQQSASVPDVQGEADVDPVASDGQAGSPLCGQERSSQVVQELTLGQQDLASTGGSAGHNLQFSQPTQKDFPQSGSPAGTGQSTAVPRETRSRKGGRQTTTSSGNDKGFEPVRDTQSQESGRGLEETASDLSTLSSGVSRREGEQLAKGSKVAAGGERSDGQKQLKTNRATSKDSDPDSFEEESSQVLHSLKQLRTPALGQHGGNAAGDTDSLAVAESLTSHMCSQGPKVSRIVKKTGMPSPARQSQPHTPSPVRPPSCPGTPDVASKRSVSPSRAEGLPVPDGKRRRAATKVNYAELPLNTKLRRGDPFTSHYCSTEKLDIFKSPKSKAKRKADLRRDILGPLHNLAIKEEVTPGSESKPSAGDV